MKLRNLFVKNRPIKKISNHRLEIIFALCLVIHLELIILSLLDIIKFFN